jgi:hypothetical protein
MTTNKLLFKNSKMTFDTTDNYNHKVVALDDIKAGELLMVEKVDVEFDGEKLIAQIASDKELFDNLYPRFEDWEDYYNDEQDYAESKFLRNQILIDSDKFPEFIDTELQNIKHELREKNANVKSLVKRYKEIEHFMKKYYNYYEEYKMPPVLHAVGVHICKFNHENIPNAMFHFTTYNINKVFASVTAIGDIKKGQEINVFYGDLPDYPWYSNIPANTAKFEYPKTVVSDKVLAICNNYIVNNSITIF